MDFRIFSVCRLLNFQSKNNSSWASPRLHQRHHRDLLPLQLAIALGRPKVIAPENRPLEKEIPIGHRNFYGLYVSFGKCTGK